MDSYLVAVVFSEFEKKTEISHTDLLLQSIMSLGIEKQCQVFLF